MARCSTSASAWWWWCPPRTGRAGRAARRRPCRHRGGRLVRSAARDGRCAQMTAATTTEALIDHLLTHAVRRGDFVLKSGGGERLVHRRQADDVPPRRHVARGRGAAGGPARRRDGARRADDGRRRRRLRHRGDRRHTWPAAQGVQRPQGGQGPRRRRRLAGALDPATRWPSPRTPCRGVSMLEAAEVVRRAVPSPSCSSRWSTGAAR